MANYFSELLQHFVAILRSGDGGGGILKCSIVGIVHQGGSCLHSYGVHTCRVM